MSRKSSQSGPAIGDYLIDRLYALGVRHVFGIPGDYILGFYDTLLKSRLQIVNTCDEQGAGFAADGFARLSGRPALPMLPAATIYRPNRSQFRKITACGRQR